MKTKIGLACLIFGVLGFLGTFLFEPDIMVFFIRKGMSSNYVDLILTITHLISFCFSVAGIWMIMIAPETPFYSDNP